jgi:hypothetical protein
MVHCDNCCFFFRKLKNSHKLTKLGYDLPRYLHHVIIISAEATLVANLVAASTLHLHQGGRIIRPLPQGGTR